MDDGKRSFLRLPVVSLSAEYLVMGHLMRRNVLAYKAPPNNEGYDLICIHPDPRHQPVDAQRSQVRVQVKSRYQSDSDRGFPVKRESLDAFDFLVVVFLNIGAFFRGKDGSTGSRAPEFYTLPAAYVRGRHVEAGGWQKASLRGVRPEILAPFRDDLGFEQIAQVLGVPRPSRASGPG
jgi:hypothetical protein